MKFGAMFEVHARYRRWVKAYHGWTSSQALIAVGFLLSSLIACQPPGAPLKPGSSSPTPQRQPHELSQDEKVAMADVLVDEAEELLRPSRFPEAQAKLEEALRYDTENVRAQFWQRFLGVMLEFNGIIGRLRPFYESQPGGSERWSQLSREVLPSSTDEWRQYLRTGKSGAEPPLENAESVRAYLDRVIDRAEVLRQWLKANREREFTLRMPQDLIGNTWMSRGSSQRCLSPGLGPLRLISQNCGPGAMYEAKMNRADLDLVQIWLGSLEFQLILAQTYVVNPQVLIDLPKSNERDFIQALLRQQSGELRAQNKLSLFRELTSEALMAMRFAMQRQAELCPRGAYQFNNRPGYMFSIGICMRGEETSPERRTMAVMESILAGRPVRVDYGDTDLEIQALQLTERPPQSLAFLNRVSFDTCSQIEAVALQDQAILQSYVASGRLESLLRSSERMCRPARETLSSPIAPAAVPSAASGAAPVSGPIAPVGPGAPATGTLPPDVSGGPP